MQNIFNADYFPVLIGSLPGSDHMKADGLVFKTTPEIPSWVQLPFFSKEGMIEQFLTGMPGLQREDDKLFINTSHEGFDDELLRFYEEYMAVSEGEMAITDSRFTLEEDGAKGFYILLESLRKLPVPPIAVKGQVTGPMTFNTGVKDEKGRAIFYSEQLRDTGTKMLALKAKWQVQKLSGAGCPVLIFLDEPSMAGFGSSELISITRDEVSEGLEEVTGAIHSEGGLAGIHVCANTDWSVILESSIDIVNFDAYSFFDKFILYPDPLKKFMERGGILAWGLIPTSLPEDIERETAASLIARFQDCILDLEALGIDPGIIQAQSLITPSCGAGSISLDLAEKVLKLTREVSDGLRKN